MIKRLRLQAYDVPEFVYDENLSRSNLLVIPSQYPYKWILIKYGSSMIEAYKDKRFVDMRRAMTHELLHVLTDEVWTKFKNRANDREFGDSMESLIEHLATVLVDRDA